MSSYFKIMFNSDENVRIFSVCFVFIFNLQINHENLFIFS